MQYQHNGALSWLQTGSTSTIVMKMAAVQGRASLCGTPETALERSLSMKRNNAENVTVNGLILDFICLLTWSATPGPWNLRLLHLKEHTHFLVPVFRKSAHPGCPANLTKQELCVRTSWFKSTNKKLLLDLQQARLATDATGCGMLWWKFRPWWCLVLLEDRFILQQIRRSIWSLNASSPQKDVERRTYLLPLIPFCRSSPPPNGYKQLLF